MSELKTITIPIELANGIAGYLGQRPFIEVQGLISQLQQYAAASASEPTKDAEENNNEGDQPNE